MPLSHVAAHDRRERPERRAPAGEASPRGAAVAAGGVPAPGAAGARVRRDRRGVRNDARRRARALSPRGQAIEGAYEMKEDGTLHDAMLQDAARRLGAGAAERLDVERTAQAVVARLREERQAPRQRWARLPASWLRIAAALVLLAGAGLVARELRGPGGAPQVEAIDLGDLSPDQLRELLDAVDEPGAQEPVSAQDVGLEDLTPQQLRTLLASLEA